MFDCPCFSRACLRAGAIRLSMALVLALLVVPGYLVAPVLFAHLDTHAQAGHLAGIIFHIANRGILILLLALTAFWWDRCAGRWRWVMLAAVACLVGLNEFLLSPVMEHLKSVMGSIDALSPGDPQRAEFGMWYGTIAVLHLLAVILSIIQVALGWDGHRGEHCKP